MVVMGEEWRSDKVMVPAWWLCPPCYRGSRSSARPPWYLSPRSKQQQIVATGEAGGQQRHSWKTGDLPGRHFQCHPPEDREKSCVHTRQAQGRLDGDCKNTHKGQTGQDLGTWNSLRSASLEDKQGGPQPPPAPHCQDQASDCR